MQMLTPEKKAEIDARMKPRLERLKSKPKPKVVAVDGAVIRDADVIVSRADPNARHGVTEVVSVRRPEYVTINMPLAEAQWWSGVRAQAADRQRRREADPFRLGHWGPIDEESY